MHMRTAKLNAAALQEKVKPMGTSQYQVSYGTQNRRCRHRGLGCWGSLAPRRLSAGALWATAPADHQSPLVELLTTHGGRITTAAQMAWDQVIQPGDTVIDATCGNGNDTLFLARAVGPAGTVYALDVQGVALQRTKQLLSSSLEASHMPVLHTLQCCHSEMLQHVGRHTARLICFNLGYLPKGDKEIVTQSETTAAAVNAALQVVCPGGLVSVMAYIGHDGGLEEYQTVKEILLALPPSSWTSLETSLLNRSGAPVLLLAWKAPSTTLEGRS